jgi:D-proline reductase (dithiol) PrdB
MDRNGASVAHLNRMKSWPWAYDDVINLALPTYETTPWTPAKPLSEARITLISTAAVHRRDDKRFSMAARDYRCFGAGDKDLIQSHHSGDHDRTGYQQDLNLILPFDRLRELMAAGELGSIAKTHYSFLGGSPPEDMERFAHKAAEQMKAEAVDTVLLCPV